MLYLSNYLYLAFLQVQEKKKKEGRKSTGNKRPLWTPRTWAIIYFFIHLHSDYTLCLHLSRLWTGVYTSEVGVNHHWLFLNFQGKKKWRCTKDAPFVLALWWSYIPLSDSFFLSTPQGSIRTSKVSSWSRLSCSSSQGHYVCLPPPWSLLKSPLQQTAAGGDDEEVDDREDL